MLRFTFFCFAERHYAEYLFAECRGTIGIMQKINYLKEIRRMRSLYDRVESELKSCPLTNIHFAIASRLPPTMLWRQDIRQNDAKQNDVRHCIYSL
jgi:hypothetical protein